VSCFSRSQRRAEAIDVRPSGDRTFLRLGRPSAWLGYLTFAAKPRRSPAGARRTVALGCALSSSAAVGAIVWVHAGNGWVFTAPNGGWEYPAYLVIPLRRAGDAGDGVWHSRTPSHDWLDSPPPEHSTEIIHAAVRLMKRRSGGSRRRSGPFSSSTKIAARDARAMEELYRPLLRASRAIPNAHHQTWRAGHEMINDTLWWSGGRRASFGRRGPVSTWIFRIAYRCGPHVRCVTRRVRRRTCECHTPLR